MRSIASTTKNLIRKAMPEGVALAVRGRGHGIRALLKGFPGQSVVDTYRLLAAFERASNGIPCGHSEEEMLRLAQAIFTTPATVPGVIIECGCWKGGSTAKLSLAAAAMSRQLYCFDSFAGIPPNSEGAARNIHGAVVSFEEGDYTGTIDEVSENVRNFGDESVTTFVKGYFENTLPHFKEAVAVAYIDVDLVSSTMTCLEYLWPRLSPGGVIYSQDGHLTDVVNAMADPFWWREKMHCARPFIFGAGSDKLIYISK